ncbi:FG-GAP-like repeat-containing protein [Neptunicoccus sediminis]|uniref:FG-GAP-like repeat-containing protein n=1 Tax=Neptunicoccus sediminis TaxID=1892596 RepID=UPI00084601B3|nr:FG-GAP-like repeat-containing protein [Neptunicoccus sediminis]
MQTLVTPPFQKRAFFTLLLIVGLAAVFWTQSRYPALDEKAMMSGAIQLEDSLSFEAKYPILDSMPVWEKIGLSTLNWLHTNKNGMTFGLLFGAAMLTFFGYLRQRSFKGGYLNSLLGLFIGAPLGVCVNCAAPIAKGLYAAGMRAETTLSAMVASPTLNAVVMTMLISLLPLYMVVTKVVLSLFVILIAVPLVCRLLPRSQLEVPPPVPATGWDLPDTTPQSEPLLAAFLGFVKAYAVNLWFILRTTVPLMLLAGFLGAIVGTLIPPETLEGMSFSVFIVVAVALVGLFLPVPIAFDVVLAGALLSAGLAPGYVMALLFTLGIFSIYSFFIVAGSISLRAALLMSGVIMVLGIGAGIGTQSYYNWQSKRALNILLSKDHSAPFSLIPIAHAQEATADITITKMPFTPPSPAAETPFTRLEGWEIGIDKPIEFSFQDMWPPFWEGRSLSSGDVDGDGDMDLLIASTYEGLYLYDNDGAGQFTRRALDLGPLASAPVFNAALVDLDGDGWLDIFVTTYRQGNFLITSDRGDFSAVGITPVANREDAILSLALSFADLDRDGDLDVALGNWAAGWYRRIPGEESRNRILLNDAGTLDGSRFTDLPGIPGETLSILFSDINGDGTSDLLVGNDFEIPDYFYLGDGKGGFEAITYAQNIIPHTTTTTMAIKTADLLNDGTPEIYLAQIAGRSSGVSSTLKMQPLEQYCDGIKRAEDKETCARNMAIKTWYKSGNNFDPSYAARCATLVGRDQRECKGMLVKDLAIQQNDPAVCNLIPADQSLAKAYCTAHFRPIRQPTQAEADAAIQQILRSNVLLEQNGAQGLRFEDTAETRGLDVGGWSWDTKIADFDNDGAQDVYIVNGTWVPNEVSPSNLFFHNQGDGSFVESSGPFGLEDYLMTATATAFDMDGDGDLDMVAHPVNGPLTVFRNNSQEGNAIAFRLEDHTKKNRFGIGAVVQVTTQDGSTQSRELQLGGGFMSFDAPVAHFGLGAQTGITSARIRWPDGRESETGPLTAGATYRVIR